MAVGNNRNVMVLVEKENNRNVAVKKIEMCVAGGDGGEITAIET